MTPQTNRPKRICRHMARLLTGTALGLAISSGAFARESVTSQAATPQDEPDQEAATVEDIVVTARQRSSNLQDTPFSITAVTASRLEALGVQTVIDLDSTVPSLQFSPDTTRLQPFLGIRGVGDYSRNPGFDNRAGIYVDGILLGRSMTTDVPVFDIERVEVLRGPQGTLFGKDSLTGVISVTSVKPSQTDSWKTTLRAGSRNMFEATGFFNAALTDTMALRVALSGQSHDGYYRNLFNDEQLGSALTFAGRVQYRWTPSDDTTIDVAADYVRAEQDPVWNGRPLTGPGAPGLGDFEVNTNRQTTKDRTLYGVSLNIEHNLPAGFVLTAISSYRSAESSQLNNDLDLSPLDQAVSSVRDRDRNYSQELRIASPDNENFNYVVGAFYYQQHPELNNRVSTGANFAVPALRFGTVNVDTNVKQTVEALYAHGTYKPAAWLALDAGLRWSHTSKEIEYSSVPGVLALAGYANVPDYRDSLSEEDISPMASLTVTPFKDFNAYVLYSTGSRAGGYNADLTQQSNFIFGGIKFDSESVTNYEVGFKSRLFDRRLRFNVAAYRMEFDDFQVSQQSEASTLVNGVPTFVRFNSITNAATAISQGVEIDFDAVVFGGLRLAGGLGFNRAYFESFPNAFLINPGPPAVFGNYDGNRLIEAPRFNGSLTADYTWDLASDWSANASLSLVYKSETFSDPSNAPTFRQSSYGTVNGRFGVTDEDRGVEVSLFARNLLDERHIEAASTSGLGYAYQTFNEPRMVGIELQLRR